MHSFPHNLLKRWNIIFAFVLVGAVLGLAGSLVQPLKYSSTVSLLIVPKNVSTVDPYTALRSIDRIADSLSQVIYTSTFFDKALANTPAIDQLQFSTDEIRKRKKWRTTIAVSVNRGTGLMKLTAYHVKSAQARTLVVAIADVLIAEGWQYVGGDLEIKLVDTPLESRFPVRPFIPGMIAGGAVAGIFFGIAYVTWHSKNRAKHIFGIG